MIRAIRRYVAGGFMLFALAALLLTNGSMLAQTPTATTSETPASGEMNMTMPANDDAQMDQMLEQCMAMMEMMMTMMGSGDMSMMPDTAGPHMDRAGGTATPSTAEHP